jgi:hypothetical protein
VASVLDARTGTRVTLAGVAVLVDPPMWPRHGRIWGHMVSDTSLEELHAIAREAGIPARGFDRDHYDVPAEMIDQLVALGAVQVSSRELIVRLRASGLRVTASQRNGRA